MPEPWVRSGFFPPEAAILAFPGPPRTGGHLPHAVCPLHHHSRGTLGELPPAADPMSHPHSARGAVCATGLCHALHSWGSTDSPPGATTAPSTSLRLCDKRRTSPQRVLPGMDVSKGDVNTRYSFMFYVNNRSYISWVCVCVRRSSTRGLTSRRAGHSHPHPARSAGSVKVASSVQHLLHILGQNKGGVQSPTLFVVFRPFSCSHMMKQF